MIPASLNAVLKDRLIAVDLGPAHLHLAADDARGVLDEQRLLGERQRDDGQSLALRGSDVVVRDLNSTNGTFINGISGAQETTYVDPSDNFFRFNLDA